MIMHLVYLGTIKMADTVDTNIYCHFTEDFSSKNFILWWSENSISPSCKGVIRVATALPQRSTQSTEGHGVLGKMPALESSDLHPTPGSTGHPSSAF